MNLFSLHDHVPSGTANSSSGTKNQFAWWYAPPLVWVTPLTQSSVGLFKVQLWQVSSSSTPAPIVSVLTSASNVQRSFSGSHGPSSPHPTAPAATTTQNRLLSTMLYPVSRTVSPREPELW